MNYDDRFNRYYLNYLGISIQDLNNGKVVFGCSQRNKPINTDHFQYLIMTNMVGINTFSIVPTIYNDFLNYILPYKDLDSMELPQILKFFFDKKFEKYSVRKMSRMTLESSLIHNETMEIVVKLTKEILMDHLHGESEEVKNRIWLRKKEEVIQGRQYVILQDHKIVSYCKISDINYCGGNLVVYTSDKCRCKGYGKAVVTEAIKWCKENEVIPVYWVDQNNMPSVALAKGLGLQMKAEEIVVGTN